MRNVAKALDRLNQWVFNMIAVIFGVVSLLTLYQVFARYVLKDPLVWSEEVIRYFIIWIVFLGMAVAVRKGLLISVEIVQHNVPRKVRKFMGLLTVLVNMFFLLILIVYGFGIMDNLAGQTTGSIEIPVSWTYAAIPVGSVIAFLNCVVVMIELFLVKEGDKHGGDFIL